MLVEVVQAALLPLVEVVWEGPNLEVRMESGALRGPMLLQQVLLGTRASAATPLLAGVGGPVWGRALSWAATWPDGASVGWQVVEQMEQAAGPVGAVGAVEWRE